jgi:hypothetical protein
MANATISSLKSLYATPSRHRDASTETLSPLQARAHALRRELAAVNAAEATIDVPAGREFESNVQQIQTYLKRTESMVAGLRLAATSMRDRARRSGSGAHAGPHRRRGAARGSAANCAGVVIDDTTPNTGDDVAVDPEETAPPDFSRQPAPRPYTTLPAMTYSEALQYARGEVLLGHFTEREFLQYMARVPVPAATPEQGAEDKITADVETGRKKLAEMMASKRRFG